MKKIANYLIALAVMAFTFTSCEDVPSPFGDIVKPASEEAVVIEPKGSGAESDPYNVAALLEFVSGLGADTPSDKEVYFQGYVTETTDISAQYGNATFYISDNAEGTANKFYVFRAKGLGGENVTDEKFLKVSDFVVMCGKVTNYKGNTPETVQGAAYVVSINGEGGGGTKPDTPTGDAKGSGTLDDPYNAAGANKYIASLAADKDSDKDIYIKGKLVKYAKNGEFSAQYGNASFYLSDDGKETSEQFYVFRTLYLGNVKYTSGDTPKTGDDIIICGKVVNYQGNTPETSGNKSYIYSWNGKTEAEGGSDTPTDTPSASGDGTADSPYNVPAAIAAGSGTGVYIKGYIVGSVTDKSISSAEFSTSNASQTNILVAASADETDINNCMPVQLPAGDVRTALNLKDNTGNYKKEVTLYGNIEKYFSVTGIKSVTYAIINGREVGKKPDASGGESGGGNNDGATTLSVDFKANGQGDWTITEVKALPSDLKYVWTYDSQYGMKASAYVNKTRYETDSWLVSPALNLANGGTMTFEQALNYATSDYVKVMYTTTDNATGAVNASEWKEASVDTWPAGNNWNFIESKATLPAGTVRVAFRYTSDTAKAATWEIKSATIK